MNYLYNGVELPELPDWDKEKYPVATVIKCSGDYEFEYGLLVANFLPVMTGTERMTGKSYPWDGNWWDNPYSPFDGRLYPFAADAFAWGEPEENWTLGVEGNTRKSGLTPVWSNTDIYYSTHSNYADSLGDLAGTLFLAASEPVPVAPDLDPTSWLSGYRLGCIARENLRKQG